MPIDVDDLIEKAIKEFFPYVCGGLLVGFILGLVGRLCARWRDWRRQQRELARFQQEQERRWLEEEQARREKEERLERALKRNYHRAREILAHEFFTAAYLRKFDLYRHRLSDEWEDRGALSSKTHFTDLVNQWVYEKYRDAGADVCHKCKQVEPDRCKYGHCLDCYGTNRHGNCMHLKCIERRGHDVCWGCKNVDPPRCDAGHCLKCTRTCPLGHCQKCRHCNLCPGCGCGGGEICSDCD